MAGGERQLSLVLRAKDLATATINKFRSVVTDTEKALFSVGGAMKAAFAYMGGQALAGVAKSFVDTAASVELTKIQLDRLFGGAAEGKRAFDWLMSNQFPYKMEVINSAFVKMQAAGLKPMEGSFRTISDAVAAFGGSSEALDRVTVAIAQMAGKGMVSMEELRQQLGEHIPTAIRDMAEGLGISVADLMERTKKANLTAEEGLAAMFKVWETKFGGATKSVEGSFTGMIQTLQRLWYQFQFAVMESGVFDYLKGALSAIIGKINEMKAAGTFQKFAADLGNSLLNIAKILINLIPNALLSILQLATQVSKIFYGWQYIFLGLKQAFLSFELVIMEGLNAIQRAHISLYEKLNVGGVFDNMLNRARSDKAVQDSVISQINHDLYKAAAVQEKLVNGQTDLDESTERLQISLRSLQGEYEGFVAAIEAATARQAKASAEASAAGAAAESLAKSNAALAASYGQVTRGANNAADAIARITAMAGLPKEDLLRHAERTE